MLQRISSIKIKNENFTLLRFKAQTIIAVPSVQSFLYKLIGFNFHKMRLTNLIKREIQANSEWWSEEQMQLTYNEAN